MPVDRRRFLESSLAVGAAALVGCGDDTDASGFPSDGGARAHDASGDGGGRLDAGFDADVGAGDAALDGPGVTADVGPSCLDAFESGILMGTLAFADEPEQFHTVRRQGHDGRLYTDLRAVDHGVLTIPNDRFFIRTLYPDLIEDTDVANIRVHGLVNAEVSLRSQDIVDSARTMGVQTLECSGNSVDAGFGLLSSADWHGVPITEVLADVEPAVNAIGIEVSGFDQQTHVSTHSTRGASWIYTFEQLDEWGVFLATHMNGEALPRDHGAPVRLIAPNWYGCCCIKWVNEIRYVGADEPATAQMMEFAGRTHQLGVPNFARDYAPATMQQAAMPVRVDKYRLADDSVAYRVVGILWGGEAPTDALHVRFGDGQWQPVDVCPPMEENAAWTVWEHFWRPSETGSFAIRCRIEDASVATNRLDAARYLRTILIEEV